MSKARCGHYTSQSELDTHHGLCRRCHSDFIFLIELEEKAGEDALVEYWYSKIISHLSDERDVNCFVNHLIEFYERKLSEFPSKEKYIQKMLYMLRSVKEPFKDESLI